MDTEENENGISLGELFRIILKRIWYVLGVSVLAAVIAALCSAFIFDNTEYHLGFNIAYPGRSTMKYPDGKPFYYSDIVSLESLQAAKDSDEAFAKIDVEKMYENDAISISAERVQIEENYQETGTYTITVPSGYFSDRNQATAFIRALANMPVQYARDAASKADYTSNLEAYRAVPSFEMKLGYLKEQKKALLAQYDEWISMFGENYRNRTTGKTLKAYRTEAEIAFTDVVENKLNTELELNGYVSVTSLDERKVSLQSEKNNNDKKLAALMAQWAEIKGDATEMPPSFAEEIAKLSARNAQIDLELTALSDANIEETKKNITAYSDSLDAVAEKLEAVTETMSGVSVSLYNQEATVRFQTTKAVEEGGTSLILVTVAGFIAGLVIACVVVCIIDVPKYRKARAQEEAAPAEEEEQKEN